MQLKLLENVQGRDISGVTADGITVTLLSAGEVYDVNATLAAWLLEHHKAEIPSDEPHYGGQAQAELRHDEELYEQMTADTTAQAEAEDIMTTDNQATSKRRRGKK